MHHVVHVQALDQRLKDVGINVENNLFDRLARVAHQHGHTGRCTPSAANSGVVTRDVARDACILVGPRRELVENLHQLTGNTLRLEEFDRRGIRSHRV